MKTVKETRLHYQKGTSNKVYNVYLVEISRDTYLVNFEYGRVGGKLKEGTKTASAVDLTKAQKVFDSLVNSKIKKEYKVEAGFNTATGKEKKKRDTLSSDEYKAILLERLSRVKEIKNQKLEKIDNYETSRLIYRVGELKIVEAKELIIKLYELNTNEDNAFYYAIAWALGRYKDPNLRAIIESLREKLDHASRYIVEEALFALNEPQEELHIEALILPMLFRISLQEKSHENFITQVKLLEEMIGSTYQRYKDADDYWDDDLRKSTKKELMPLLAQADELYLKLYMLAIIDERKHEAMVKIISHLPLNEFNFSLFRRLYKMAEFREDQAILAELISKIEAKKMACYQSYNYNTEKYKLTIGCSRLYFKKRSMRYIKSIATHDEGAYLIFAKNILLSMNSYTDEFEAFTSEWYDENWNLKTKKYDAYSTHLTFMSILYGAGKRYMLAPSKKMWETANQSIKDEYRPEMYKELWNKHPLVAFHILVGSSVEPVQLFAFSILKDNHKAIEGILNNIPLSYLNILMQLAYTEAREFFFELLKKRYEEKREPEVAIAFLLSADEKISFYGVEKIGKSIEVLYREGLIFDILYRTHDSVLEKILPFLKSLNEGKKIIDDFLPKVLNSNYLSTPYYANRILKILKALSAAFTIEHLELFMREKKFNDAHIFGSKIIRSSQFSHLKIPLVLKEKIAIYDNPEMLATTIYLLGKLSNDELMEAYPMLISFLYHEEVVVHSEAQKIIIDLGKEQKNAEILLQAIVEKSFLSSSDMVANNVEKTVEALNSAYSSVNIDQLYRILIAKSKLALRLGTLILSSYDAKDFSVVQWARLAKNPNRTIRIWAYDAYMDNVEMVQKSMPNSLMIFDTHWEDTRQFASGYFESFGLNSDEIVVVADSNYHDVQLFAKKMIEQGDFDTEVILTKLSQHPALTIQKFVTDLMLGGMNSEQLLKMERFFNTLLHSVNTNRVAKTRVMEILNRYLDNKKIAQMYGRLASHHSATMVWADKEIFVEAMSYIKDKYDDINLPLLIEESKKREVV